MEVAAAVAENHLAGDEFGVVAGEECDQSREVFGRHTFFDRLIRISVEQFINASKTNDSRL